MPVFLNRLRQSLRRHPQDRLHPETLNTPTGRNHEAGERDDVLRYELEGHQPRRSNSPPTLPVIRDLGPPTAQRYPNPDIFWNSVMEEGDLDYTPRSRLSPFGDKVKSKHSDFSSATDTQSKNETPKVNSAGDKKGVEEKHSSAHYTTAQQRSYGTQSPRRHGYNNSHSGKTTEKDLVVMHHGVPDYFDTGPSPLQQEATRDSLPIVNIGWDEIMDRSPPSNRPTQIENGLSVIHEDPEPPRTLPYHQESNGTSTQDAQPIEHLTWNACLNKILNHEALDPQTKDAVEERVKRSTTVNGVGDGTHMSVSTEEAGMVPNFSYPIVGSPFYDRIAAQRLPPQSLTIVGPDDQFEERQTSTNNRSSSSFEAFDFDPDLHSPTSIHPATGSSTNADISDNNTTRDFCQNPVNGTSSFQSSTSSSPDPSHGCLTPPSDSTINHRIKNLLRELLSESEIHLFHQILEETPASTIPRNASTTSRPSTNGTKSHRADCLIRPLYTIIHHLQDRATYLEDQLLPQVGASLEQKTYAIDVLSIEIQTLGDQVRELSTTVDLGNRILAGCWIRDYELWRTLATIKEKRRLRRGSLLRRLTGRSPRTSELMKEGVLSPYRKEEGAPAKQHALTERELDALTDMADQNVQIIRDDIDDMVERVLACKRKFQAYPAVEREEGSWRDV